MVPLSTPQSLVYLEGDTQMDRIYGRRHFADHEWFVLNLAKYRWQTRLVMLKYSVKAWTEAELRAAWGDR